MEKVTNKKGLIGFAFGLLSIALGTFLLPQILAIVFGIRGWRDAKKNPMLSTWQYKLAIFLGIGYIASFLMNISA